MLMRLFMICLLVSSPALGAGPGWLYYVGTGPTPCATIEALDAAHCASLGCDGVTTTHWFDVTVLDSGVCAIRVQPGTSYQDVTIHLPPSAKFPSGLSISLTAGQIAALVTRASLAGQLPTILTLASFEAVLTTAQINALNNINQVAHPALYSDWQSIVAGGVVDMLDPAYLDLMSQGLSLGLITQAEYATLTTPSTVAMGP